ncbi:MAG TPA: helix-turn-helix transcriptional regulator [Myxococcota bacterium]|nr:helix-turn-helix transcriptional regulator [Myxococcota bacterium]HRY96594.1 helix-turn-helix transcriptional regulator [Myxococcota bacterium]HSA24572.1 helix-turn-helix transcriptional regulator [Myxococcota bacterium]
MDPDLVTLGRWIRDQRQQQGLTQEELAFRSGLHRTYVGSVERGERNLSVLNIIRLARALGVQPAELLQCLGPESAVAVGQGGEP